MIQALAPATTAVSRYEDLAHGRQPFIDRARECSKLTIPHMMPPEGSSGGTDLYTPFQSVGARGVNNLGSKIFLAIFPPTGAFFRLTMDDFVVQQLREQSGSDEDFEDARAEFEEALGKMERSVQNRIETSGARAPLHFGCKHLVVTGNVLLFIGKGGSVKAFSLDKYVVKRDNIGTVLEIIVKETMAKSALPERAQGMLAIAEINDPDLSSRSLVDLYTRITRNEHGKYRVSQEIEGQEVPESEGFYPADKLPWLPLRFHAIDGEDYGRGHVEDYLGDLMSLEALSQAIVEFSGVASKILFLVKENGTTSIKKLSEARSGDFVKGDERDVTTLGLKDKVMDFQVTKVTADGVEQRLSQAFLLSSSVQRQAERVTAEEIRFMAGELEQALGGVYSVLSQEMQLPLVRVLMSQMQREGKLPHLPEKSVSPQIVTGLEGLGRSSDLIKLDILLSGIQQQFGPEAVAEYINLGAYAKRRGTALGIDLSGIIRSEQEVQKARAAASQRESLNKLAPTLVKTAGDQMKAANTAAPTTP